MWKGILGTRISVHRTSVLQEHSGVCGQCEAVGILQGEVQGGGMRLERQQQIKGALRPPEECAHLAVSLSGAPRQL